MTISFTTGQSVTQFLEAIMTKYGITCKVQRLQDMRKACRKYRNAVKRRAFSLILSAVTYSLWAERNLSLIHI